MDLLEEIKSLALRAGALALGDRDTAGPEVACESKSTATDIVTATDRRVEAFVVEAAAKLLPGSAFYGEESGERGPADAEFRWIIDPVDGTANFARDLPNWAVSIALWRNGAPFIGVVFAPRLRELYYAQLGEGAYCNGRRLRVSTVDRMERAAFSTGFSCLRAGWTEETNLKFFARLAPGVLAVRRLGCASIDLACVAAGKIDFAWELDLGLYDHAAGQLLVTEAGGRFSDLTGGNDSPRKGSIGSNGILHEKVLSYFHDYRALRR